MSDTRMAVLVAGYPSVEAARQYYDAVVELVKGKQVQVQSVILVAHDDSGEVTVLSTGDHLGRKGSGWGAGHDQVGAASFHHELDETRPGPMIRSG